MWSRGGRGWVALLIAQDENPKVIAARSQRAGTTSVVHQLRD
jgi:hypothetical protein